MISRLTSALSRLPSSLSFAFFSSSNLSAAQKTQKKMDVKQFVEVCRWQWHSQCVFLLPMLCRTPLRQRKWSSSQRPGALTAKLSKNFSTRNIRVLISPFLSKSNQAVGFHDHVHRPCTLRLDKRSDGSAIQAYLAEKTNQRTVPNVFVSEYDMLWLAKHKYNAFWI